MVTQPRIITIITTRTTFYESALSIPAQSNNMQKLSCLVIRRIEPNGALCSVELGLGQCHRRRRWSTDEKTHSYIGTQQEATRIHRHDLRHTRVRGNTRSDNNNSGRRYRRRGRAESRSIFFNNIRALVSGNSYSLATQHSISMVSPSRLASTLNTRNKFLRSFHSILIAFWVL